MTIYGDTCPKCDGDVDEMDACDGPDGRPVAKLRCVDCGHKFDIEQVWILSE